MNSPGIERASRKLVAAAVSVFALALAPGCEGTPPGQEHEPDPDAPQAEPSSDPDSDPDSAVALLEIYAMDIWAQFLPEEAEITVRKVDAREEDQVPPHGFPVAGYPLYTAGDYIVELSAPEHRTLALAVHFDGGATLDGLSVSDAPAPDQGFSLSHEMRVLRPEEPALPVHTLYLGLRHKWFSAQGRPARRGNRVDLLMDGAESWSAVHRDLVEAQKTVELSTWWWESEFELVRDPDQHAYLSDEQRWDNTILGVLDSSAAKKRVLVGQIWRQDGLLDWLTVDSDLRDRGETPSDGFEFMGQANETFGVFWFEPDAFTFADRVQAAHTETAARDFDAEEPISSPIPPREVDLNHWPFDIEVQHASYHQKFLVVDAETAFVGGMNLRRVDWDTSQHLVFEPRRMLFDASESERLAVADRDELPDTGPRKDYMVRIEGPATQDVAEVFKQRWDLAMYQEVDYAENASSFEVERDLTPIPDGKQIQITTTLPEPFWEHSIAETWINAVENAEQYILIEDQYFRAPMLNDLIVERMTEAPELKLIVITKPVSEWTDPGCAWTHASHALFETLFPDRYQIYQLRSFAAAVTWGFDETDSFFEDMDTHSKLLIVDDLFLSVGSANKNNRSMVYEGEMNVAVLDRDWVTEQRRRILANILPAGTQPSDNVYVWSAQLRDAAEWNDYVYSNWDAEGWDISLDGAPLPYEYTPEGFVYSLDFRAVEECLIEDVGPDMA